MRRIHTILVVAVFLASLATLVASSTIALLDSTDELAAQDRLRDTASRIAVISQDLVAHMPPDYPGSVLPEAENVHLAAIISKALRDYPEADGGFYLAESDQFAGVITPVHPPDVSLEKGEKGKKAKGANPKGDKKKADGKSLGKTEPVAGRRDPPPLETNLIRQLARSSLGLEPGSAPLVEIRDIGPSRVALAVAPVGDERPTRAVVWLMVRLSGPAQQKERLQRLQLATGLSLAGMVLAIGLTIGLVRHLRHEMIEREKLRDELRKSEHLAVLGRMLAGVAHEVRNPLTAIRSTVQLWERLPDRARTPESLAAVIASVDRLNELVSRLLLFARGGHEIHRQVDLNAVVAETLELIRAQADMQSVAIQAELAPELPPVPGAAQALGQVVLNLVTNSLQTMPNGGRLLCRTQVLADGRVDLEVSDTGPGVPEEDRALIFEPFYTTRTNGTGIGLALCREVARQHGGDVTLDAAAKFGAVFHLSLPVVHGEGP